ncbi:MAG: hypothetical protein REI12_08180 [Pedobacter sp.]|nr:hypothetical protein [Pedobacter sp.]
MSSAALASATTRTDAGLAPWQGNVQRLAWLRELASKNPDLAREETWRWLRSFEKLETHHDLGWLFAQGTTPGDKLPRGDCEGAVLGLYGALWLDGVDRLVRVGRLLGGIGWTGKTFDPKTGTGYNRLTTSARIPMLLTMPAYRFEKVGGELIGFHFDHKIDVSPLSPEQKVRSIAYDNPNYKNPLVLPRTRDELTEITPNVYLGRALRCEDGNWRVVGYFALRQPAGS